MPVFFNLSSMTAGLSSKTTVLRVVVLCGVVQIIFDLSVSNEKLEVRLPDTSDDMEAVEG
jgi:hypothetical protein